MNKYVLFLDDQEIRINWARKTWANDNLYIARNFKQFFDIVWSIKEWDLISLDHDLGLETDIMSYYPNNGMSAVEIIWKTRIKVETIVIHSINVSAADAMVLVLKHHKYNIIRLPFDKTNKIHWKGE